MKIVNVENNSNTPNYGALRISVNSLDSIKKSGQALVDKLVNTGKSFKDYKYFDLKIVDETARPVIESKDGKTIFQDFFRATIPYGNVLNISTKDGSSKDIKYFSIQYLNKHEAFNAYKKVHNDENKDCIDFAIAVTELLEKEALAKEEIYQKTDTSDLFKFIDTTI